MKWQRQVARIVDSFISNYYALVIRSAPTEERKQFLDILVSLSWDLTRQSDSTTVPFDNNLILVADCVSEVQIQLLLRSRKKRSLIVFCDEVIMIGAYENTKCYNITQSGYLMEETNYIERHHTLRKYTGAAHRDDLCWDKHIGYVVEEPSDDVCLVIGVAVSYDAPYVLLTEGEQKRVRHPFLVFD